MIQFYLNTAGKVHSYEIGSDTDWNIINNIFRKYRNYIHLQEYEKRVNDIGKLTKNDYDKLLIVYEEIVLKC